jgi:hypothetical protein
MLRFVWVKHLPKVFIFKKIQEVEIMFFSMQKHYLQLFHNVFGYF